MLEDRSYMRESPFETRRSVTLFLLIANVLAFAFECVYYGGYPPAIPHRDYLALSWEGVTRGYLWQLLTFQFLHAGILHLVFNCWTLFLFGREVEESLGIGRFLTIYFSSGAIGGLLQAATGGLAMHFLKSGWAQSISSSVVGASAGCFGLIAAFAALYPDRRLMLLLFPVSIPAKILLLIFTFLALLGIAFPGDRNTADLAHLGGIITGFMFVRYALHWSFHWPRLNRVRPSPPRRLVKVNSGGPGVRTRSKTAASEPVTPDDFLTKEVDPILDKISACGIQSLTERERKILESARERMGKS